MSGVAGAAERRRSTSDMMDQVAHDAGLVREDEHVRANAMAKSAAKERATSKDLHFETGKELGHEGAMKLGEEALEHAIEHGHVAGGGIAAGGLVATGAALTEKFLLDHAWLGPNLEADRQQNAQVNDALNLGLAMGLDVPAGFKQSILAERPDAEKPAGRVHSALLGRDKAMVPELQARCDKGYLEAKKLAEDAAHLPKEQRAAFIEKGLEKLVQRGAEDVAFGLGVKLYVWASGQDGSARAGIEQGIDSRTAVRPTFVQG